MYKIIDGKYISQQLRQRLKVKIDEFYTLNKIKIGLAVILVGDNNASKVYVKNKIKACEEVGIQSFAYYLPNDISQEELEALIESLSLNDCIHGILLQLPLPSGLNAQRAIDKIVEEKDVDGFSVNSVAKLSLGQKCLSSCTPSGIMSMLEFEGIDVTGKNAVVVGRSNIVGKPMAMMLLNSNATVTICHSKTVDLDKICAQADVLVCAIGKAKYIKQHMVKEGAIVIDVGMNRDDNGKLCGDVDFDNVKEKCSYITPVPGGVGPMTITTLMYNTFEAAYRRLNVNK